MAITANDTSGGVQNSNRLDWGSTVIAAANADSAGGYVQNPPFDARLGQRGAVDDQGNFVILPRERVQRGFIVQSQAQSDGKKYMLHFQFNPTSFSHSASLSAQIPTQGAPDQGGQGEQWSSFIANTGQQITFSLLFDRTYELWQSDGQSFAGTQGVLADIKTLYAMLGMYGTGTQIDDATGVASVDPSALSQTTPISVMTGGDPVWVNFGSMLLSYYGIIQGVNVTFTHFTQQMVPVRAAVDIQLSIIPKTEGLNDVPNATTDLTWTNTPDVVNTVNYLSARTQRVDQMLGTAANF